MPSVGKTTLAVRLVTAPEQQGNPSYYFDLASYAAMDEGSNALATTRITRPGAFLILNNIHHQPELARELWDLWRASPNGSRLLVLATDIQQLVFTSPAQDIGFFRNHPENPFVALCLKADDLWHRATSAQAFA